MEAADELLTRMVRLERELRRLRAVCAAGAVIIAGIALMGQTSALPDVHARQITAEGLTITDGTGVAIALSVNKGKSRVLIASDTRDEQAGGLLVHGTQNGPIQLSIFDRADKTTTILMSDGIKLRYDKKPHGGLVVAPFGSALDLSVDGSSAITVAASRGTGGAVHINDASGRSRWLLRGNDPREPQTR